MVRYLRQHRAGVVRWTLLIAASAGAIVLCGLWAQATGADANAILSSGADGNETAAAPTGETSGDRVGSDLPGGVWFWPVVLFFVSFGLGIIAVLGGVGGGVLYVPLIGSFLPFHIDFVRASGLLIALAGSLSGGPGLLRRGLADLRLAMPLALVTSVAAIFGAKLGLALPEWVVHTFMGVMILAITAMMALAKRAEYPQVTRPDPLSRALGIRGAYVEDSTGQTVRWQIHRTPLGLVLFVGIGILAGMFGLGAGWANVPTLNLLLGAPLKLAVATSYFMIAVTDSTAAWVYLNRGAALPIMVVPSMFGIMLGAKLGVRLLARTKPKGIRYVVLTLLSFAGLRALLKGLGIWT